MLVVEVGTTRQAEIDKKKVVIEAEAGKEKQRIEAEADVLVAEQNKLVAEHDAGAAFIQKTKDAEADLVKAKNEALGIEAKGAAEALAKKSSDRQKLHRRLRWLTRLETIKGIRLILLKLRKSMRYRLSESNRQRISETLTLRLLPMREAMCKRA